MRWFTYTSLGKAALLFLACTFGSASLASEGENWEEHPTLSSQDFQYLSQTMGDDSVLIDFTVEPYRRQGKLYGCGVSFSGLMKDWAYRNNELVIMNGSVSFFAPEGRMPYVLLRLALVDLKNDTTVLTRPASVNYAYLRSPELNLAGKEWSIDGALDDVQGSFRSFVYLAEGNIVPQVFGPGPLKIAFNRAEAGVDLEFELIMLSQPNFPEWVSCYAALLSELSG